MNHGGSGPSATMPRCNHLSLHWLRAALVRHAAGIARSRLSNQRSKRPPFPAGHLANGGCEHAKLRLALPEVCRRLSWLPVVPSKELKHYLNAAHHFACLVLHTEVFGQLSTRAPTRRELGPCAACHIPSTIASTASIACLPPPLNE